MEDISTLLTVGVERDDLYPTASQVLRAATMLTLHILEVELAYAYDKLMDSHVKFVLAYWATPSMKKGWLNVMATGERTTQAALNIGHMEPDRYFTLLSREFQRRERNAQNPA